MPDLLPEVAGRPAAQAFQSYIAQCTFARVGTGTENRFTKTRQLPQKLNSLKSCPYSKRNNITISQITKTDWIIFPNDLILKVKKSTNRNVSSE
jgi:hypothetical protein